MPNASTINCGIGFFNTCNGDTAVVWLNKLPGLGSYDTVVG